MIPDRPATDEELLNSIKRNVCNRNKDLASLIKIINYASRDNAIIALDGEWGSGKTFLIKQLELIWKRDDNPLSNEAITDDDLNVLRNKIVPFYYNAWENDYSTDASQSLLMALSESLIENKSIIEKSERKLMQSVDIKSFIKNKTNGLINLQNAESGRNEAEYAPEVNKAKKLRKIISEMIDKKLQLRDGCKLLFIIDDLDRCKPSYALNLIESIKNCLNNDRIVFLVATNFSELGKIVKGYYGGYIDGYQYLDRIFDLMIKINDIDQESYIRYRMPRLETYAIKNIAVGLKLNMRELNRLLNIVSLYESYLENSYVFTRDQKFHNICRYIFMPLFVGYKIKKYGNYEELTSGTGYKIISNYLSKNKEMRRYAIRLTEASPEEAKKIDSIIENYYNKLFSDDNTDMIEANQSFWNVLNLMSSSLDL